VNLIGEITRGAGMIASAVDQSGKIPITVTPITGGGVIDFSILATVVGAVGGGVVVLIVMAAMGYFLIKFGIVNFHTSQAVVNAGPHAEECLLDPEKCTAHKAEHERSLQNKQEIEHLRGAIGQLHSKIDTEVGRIHGKVELGFQQVNRDNRDILFALAQSGLVSKLPASGRD
jgi:hypothetical protein